MNISDAAFQLEGRMPLPADEVHLWRVDLAAVAVAEEKWRQLLSPDERARAARFHFAEDRQFFSATRALLRTILASYIGSDPAQLVFRYSEKEKPSLAAANSAPANFVPGNSGNHVEFNVSHSGTTALLAFAQGRALGVDVEKIRDDFDHGAIARRFFSEHEQSELSRLPQPEKYQGFFRCWTRKEAFIKATGTGLSFPLDQFDVSLNPEDDNALLATRPDNAEAALWSLREVPAGDGYVGAVCVQGHGWRLRF
jgi:4'-phosphopantetheinyl transferase